MEWDPIQGLFKLIKLLLLLTHLTRPGRKSFRHWYRMFRPCEPISTPLQKSVTLQKWSCLRRRRSWLSAEVQMNKWKRKWPGRQKGLKRFRSASKCFALVASESLTIYSCDLIGWSATIRRMLRINFQSMEIKHRSYTAVLAVLTPNTYIMVVSVDSGVRKYRLLVRSAKHWSLT